MQRETWENWTAPLLNSKQSSKNVKLRENVSVFSSQFTSYLASPAATQSDS